MRSLHGALLLAAAAGVVFLVWVAGDLVGLAIVGAVLAYLLQPVVDRMERGGMSRPLASAIVLVGLLALIGLGVALAAPTVVAQVTALQERWASGELLGLLSAAEQAIGRYVPYVDPDDLGLVDAAEAIMAQESAPLLHYVPGAIELLVNFFLVPFVLFALLNDGPYLRRRLVQFVPNRYFEFTTGLLFKIDDNLGGYLRGQALVALVVAVLTSAGLAALGVDYYLLLGILTGLLNFVPYIGFFVSAGLALAVAVLSSGRLDVAAGVLGLYLGLQLAENVALQPWITGKNVSLHPALVLFAILVGERMGGILGMALAVPAAAILKVVILEVALNLRRYHL